MPLRRLEINLLVAVAGSTPFAAVVRDEKALAMSALHEVRHPTGVRLTGTATLLEFVSARPFSQSAGRRAGATTRPRSSSFEAAVIESCAGPSFFYHALTIAQREAPSPSTASGSRCRSQAEEGENGLNLPCEHVNACVCCQAT